MSEPLNCPVCKASNERGPACRRCKADLGTLFDLREQRERVLAEAFRAARLGQWERAQALALGVEALRADATARRLVAWACLARRDFRGARQWHALALSAPRGA